MLSKRADEDGFTLIELLVSITILGILMAAVSAAMMVGLSTNATSGTRIDESRDEQFVAAYFSADAHGATTITAGGGGPVPAPKCNFAGGGGFLVVEFAGLDFSEASPPADIPRTVSYVRRPAPSGGTDELHRLVCTGGAAVPATGQDTTLATNLSAGGSAAACIFTPPPGGCVGVRMTLKSGTLDYAVTGYKRTT